MNVNVHIHYHGDQEVLRLLKLTLLQGKKIMATQEEHAAELASITEAVAKIGTETSATLVKVQELEDALAAGGMTSPEVDAAMAALKAQVQLVDDLIPDAS